MKWLVASIIPLVCLLLSACDAHVESDPCPAQAAVGVSDYFPLEAGLTRSFDYSFQKATTTPWTAKGVLTWHVVSAGECAFGRQIFTVEESLIYDSPEREARSRTLTFAVNDSLIYPGPYFFGGLVKASCPITSL